MTEREITLSTGEDGLIWDGSTLYPAPRVWWFPTTFFLALQILGFFSRWASTARMSSTMEANEGVAGPKTVKCSLLSTFWKRLLCWSCSESVLVTLGSCCLWEKSKVPAVDVVLSKLPGSNGHGKIRNDSPLFIEATIPYQHCAHVLWTWQQWISTRVGSESWEHDTGIDGQRFSLLNPFYGWFHWVVSASGIFLFQKPYDAQSWTDANSTEQVVEAAFIRRLPRHGTRSCL